MAAPCGFSAFYKLLLQQWVTLFGASGSNVALKNAANTFTAGPQVLNAGLTLTEQSAATGAAGKTVLYADSTSHRLTAKEADNTAQAVLLSGDVVNADLAAGAAIVDTKLATIATAGKVSDSAVSANVALENAANVFTAAQTMPTLQLAKAAVRDTLTLTPSATAGDHTADGTYITFTVSSTAGMTATTTVVVVASFTHADYNGTYRVYDVPSATTFRVAKATAEACSVVGTITHAPRVEDSGGVAHWSQAAAPTGPLAGDTWWETDTGIDWYAYSDSGTMRWLSRQLFQVPMLFNGISATAGLFGTFGPDIDLSADVFIVSGTLQSGGGGTHDADNHWLLLIITSNSAGVETNRSGLVTTGQTTANYRYGATFNSYIQTNAAAPNDIQLWYLVAAKVGTPANFYGSAVFAYRLAHR